MAKAILAFSARRIVNGEIVGIQCDVQCVSNNMNNWQYYIHRSGMTHFRNEYQISGFMRELNK